MKFLRSRNGLKSSGEADPFSEFYNRGNRTPQTGKGVILIGGAQSTRCQVVCPVFEETLKKENSFARKESGRTMSGFLAATVQKWEQNWRCGRHKSSGSLVTLTLLIHEIRSSLSRIVFHVVTSKTQCVLFFCPDKGNLDKAWSFMIHYVQSSRSVGRNFALHLTSLLPSLKTLVGVWKKLKRGEEGGEAVICKEIPLYKHLA